MTGDNSDKQDPNKMNSVIWLFIYLAIVVMLQLILPFPISFIVSIIVIMSLGIYRFNRALRKMGVGGIRDWLKSMSSSSSGLSPRGGTDTYGSAYQPLRFSCLNCAKEHDKIACPNCGSKGVRPV